MALGGVIVAKVKKVSPDQWKALVQAWRASGLSQSGFARQRGISNSALSYWQRKFDAEPVPKAARETIPLLEVRSAATGGRIEIELRGGRVLRADDTVRPERLRALVEALEARR
jgi:hypothetical protein